MAHYANIYLDGQGVKAWKTRIRSTFLYTIQKWPYFSFISYVDTKYAILSLLSFQLCRKIEILENIQRILDEKKDFPNFLTFSDIPT